MSPGAEFVFDGQTIFLFGFLRINIPQQQKHSAVLFSNPYFIRKLRIYSTVFLFFIFHPAMFLRFYFLFLHLSSFGSNEFPDVMVLSGTALKRCCQSSCIRLIIKNKLVFISFGTLIIKPASSIFFKISLADPG